MEQGAREAWAGGCRLISEDGMSDYLERDVCVGCHPCTVMQPQSHGSGDPPPGRGAGEEGDEESAGEPEGGLQAHRARGRTVQDRTSRVLSSGWSEMRANSSLGALKQPCALAGPRREGRATPRPPHGASSTRRPGSPVGAAAFGLSHQA